MTFINLYQFEGRLFRSLRYRLGLLANAFMRRTILIHLRIALKRSSPITGNAPAVVSLTSYGERIRHVHYTILTIANGVCRPKRIVLWLSHADAHLVTPELQTLQRRGLEIKITEDYGSHKKYYPYCAAASGTRKDDLPLVTADDDVLYQAQWLCDLIEAAKTVPYPAIVGHRTHRMTLINGVISPYVSWATASGSVEPSYANVATGVCGVLYPTEFITQLDKIWNTDFMELAPSADDLWLHSRGVLLGIPTRQARRVSPRILEHHPDLDQSLSMRNVIGGDNDVVISRVYVPEAVSKIESACGADKGETSL